MVDLKKKMEDLGMVKEEQDPPAEEEKILDEKEELLQFFLEKFRPRNFDLVSKVYKDNQVKGIFLLNISSNFVILKFDLERISKAWVQWSIFACFH